MKSIKLNMEITRELDYFSRYLKNSHEKYLDRRIRLATFVQIRMPLYSVLGDQIKAQMDYQTQDET